MSELSEIGLILSLRDLLKEGHEVCISMKKEGFYIEVDDKYFAFGKTLNNAYGKILFMMENDKEED